MPLVTAIILGSVRRDRIGIRAARHLMAQVEKRGHEAHLIDPLEEQLPLLDRMYKEYPPGEAPRRLEDLAALYRRTDAFIICSAEYNHSIPPALSNILDHFLEEYFWRPSAIACYSPGPFGGVRAAMQLRMMLAELGMPSIPSLLPFPRLTALVDEAGVLLDTNFQGRTDRFLSELEWYAEALQAKRATGVPH